MTTATFTPHGKENTWKRWLQMVERVNGKLVPLDEQIHGLTCSVSDMGRLFKDLVSDSSKLFKKEQRKGNSYHLRHTAHTGRRQRSE